MKKRLLSFKSVADILAYIRDKKPAQYFFDPQELRLTLTGNPEHRSIYQNNFERQIETETLADLLIDLS